MPSTSGYRCVPFHPAPRGIARPPVTSPPGPPPPPPLPPRLLNAPSAPSLQAFAQMDTVAIRVATGLHKAFSEPVPGAEACKALVSLATTLGMTGESLQGVRNMQLARWAPNSSHSGF